MCTGLPARVLRVVGLEADVDTGDGRATRASVVATESIHKGDYVLLYANLITSRMSRRSALETLEYMGEMAARAAEEDGRDAVETERLFERRRGRLFGNATCRM